MIGRTLRWSLVVGAATALVVWFIACMATDIHPGDGGICGSAWHWRASARLRHGGEVMSPARYDADACRRAAVRRFHATYPRMAEAGTGGAVAGAAVLGAAGARRRTGPAELSASAGP